MNTNSSSGIVGCSCTPLLRMNQKMDIAIVAATPLVFATFSASVPGGNAYAVRTVAAKGLRSLVGLAISWSACHWIWRSGCLRHV